MFDCFDLALIGASFSPSATCVIRVFDCYAGVVIEFEIASEFQLGLRVDSLQARHDTIVSMR